MRMTERVCTEEIAGRRFAQVVTTLSTVGWHNGYAFPLFSNEQLTPSRFRLTDFHGRRRMHAANGGQDLITIEVRRPDTSPGQADHLYADTFIRYDCS